MCSPDVFLGLLALLFPPLPVWVRRGLFSVDSLLNILLCMLGYVPGLLHAWYIIAKYPEPASLGDSYEGPSDAEGHVYVFVQDPAGNRRPVPRLARQQPRPQQQPTTPAAAPQHQQQPKPPRSQNYGTAGPAPGHAPQESGVASSSSDMPDAPPPSYAQVIAGDNKIQSQD